MASIAAITPYSPPQIEGEGAKLRVPEVFPPEGPSKEFTPTVQERDWVPYAKLAGKILFVAFTVALLAAATYFSFGAAIPLIFHSTLGIKTVVAAFAAFGFSLTLLLSPFLAFASKMFRMTKTSAQDTFNFFGAVAGLVLLYVFAIFLKFVYFTPTTE
jgi:hypothetical protein